MRSTLPVYTLLLAASTFLAAQSPQSDATKPDRLIASPAQARPPYTGQAASKDDPSQSIVILSDTLGVDFKPYIAKILPVTRKFWDQVLLKETPFITKPTVVQIRASILPNGRLEPKSMYLLSRSGNVACDRTAWSAVENSVYPALPTEFKGPRITVRFTFLYSAKITHADPSPAK